MKLNVIAKIEILPKDINVNLESIQDKIEGIVRNYGKVHKAEIKPIAFGLNSLNLTLLLSESKGGIDKIEEEIKNLNEVGEVKVTDISLL